MCKVFLSYSSKDSGVAASLLQGLKKQGLDVWFAPEQIEGGRYYKEEISVALEESAALILVASEASVGHRGKNLSESVYVRKEIELAEKGGKTILPVAIDGTLPGEMESHAMRTSLVDTQRAFDLSQGAFSESVCEAACAHLAHLVRRQSGTGEQVPEADYTALLEEALLKQNLDDAKAIAAFLNQGSQAGAHGALLSVVAELGDRRLSRMDTSEIVHVQNQIEQLMRDGDNAFGLYLLAILDVTHYRHNALHNSGLRLKEAKCRSKAIGGVKPRSRRLARVLLKDAAHFEQEWFKA